MSKEPNVREKKHREYVIEVKDGSVSVKHRPSPVFIFLALALSIPFVILRENSQETLPAFLLFLLVFGVALFLNLSREVMRCDAHELQYAHRKVLRHWSRVRVPVSEIRKLQRVVRPAGRSSYAVLTFVYVGKSVDLLRDISYTDGERVLNACRQLGIDTTVPNDPGANMIKDIERRGWFVNPLKPDRGED